MCRLYNRSWCFESTTLLIGGTFKYRIYLHNRCSDFANLDPINWSLYWKVIYIYPSSTAIPKFMVIPDCVHATIEVFTFLLGSQQGWPKKNPVRVSSSQNWGKLLIRRERMRKLFLPKEHSRSVSNQPSKDRNLNVSWRHYPFFLPSFHTDL